jgi:predicted ATP-binding protein involved in virulence
MQLQKLSLTNFRAFKQAEFKFKPGMNLIVGINGAGKSSALDAIRILSSQALRRIGMSQAKSMSFSLDDIKIGTESLTAQIDFEVSRPLEEHGEPPQEFTYVNRKSSLTFKPTKSQGEVREQTYKVFDLSVLTPDDNEIISKVKDEAFVVYYSTRRSLATRAKPKSQYDLLTHRELRITDLANWLLVRQVLGSGSYDTKLNSELKSPELAFVEHNVMKFLDGCTGLSVVSEPTPTILLNKNHTVLDISQLSDGERGILAIVMELSQLTYEFRDDMYDKYVPAPFPIVLIDELDLHLHPRWQRDIVQKLTDTFPTCQFIATTHSPQIVGEVPPEKIIILDEGKPPYRPDQSLGMDSNWILRHLMGTDDRKSEVLEIISRIAKLIEDEKYDKALTLIESSQQKYGPSAEVIKLQARIDRIRMIGE